MRRGDVIAVALQGDTDKLRPAVIVHADDIPPRDNILVVPFTSFADDAPLSRMVVAPTPGNGLQSRSELMFDRLASAQRSRCRGPFGRLDTEQMIELNARLVAILGLAEAP